jgi:hypothetical protein
VIGAALFKLKIPDRQRAPREGSTSSQPHPFPADDGPSYAPPPDYRK